MSSTTGPSPRDRAGLPLRFSNLAIPQISGGSGGSEELVQDLGNGVWDVVTFGPLRRLGAAAFGYKQTGKEKLLVAEVEGIVHQGELLLILGPPTSNASILLRALSSPSDLQLSETSQLDYGLLPQSTVTRSRSPFRRTKGAGALRSEVVYMGEHDVHFATLSLKASMLPGSRAKSPRVRPEGWSRKEWAERKLLSLVDSLGLSHALGTKVGSPLVRGLSGGERKRASIVEALLTRASVLLLDGPTNGLDSSTALSMLSFLRSWAKDGKRSLVSTAPHIADPLYNQFDKVLVLSSRGRSIFFGKANDAQAYFEALGLGFSRRLSSGEGIAEFLVGCVEGRGNDLELERAWRASRERKELLQEMIDYESRYPFATCAGPLLAALAEDKSFFTPKSTHYTVSFLSQVAILTRRQYALIASELPTYVTKTIVNLLLSLLVGTVFFALPQTTSAAFTRGSLLLLSIMFNAYLSLAELGKTLEGRDIVKRQGDWGFFGASALALARLAGDLPLIGAQVLLFGTMTYFLAGLQRTIEHFVVYILFVYATALTLSAMFRMFAAFSPSFDEAIRYCGITLNILVVYAGYFIPTPSMRPWLKWIHFVIDPISYAYEAVLVNEFHNLNLACSPSDVVPSGPSYTDSRYQTCLLPGSTPRSLVVSGDAYLATAYDFHHSNLWTNLGIMMAQALAFLIIGVVATDFLHFAPEGTKRIWARTQRIKLRLRRKWYKSDELEMGDTGLYVEPIDEGSSSSAFGETDDPLKIDTSVSVLVWRDVSLWVDTPLEARRLLDRISGYIRPGSLCALMGASGAGKSTLLNALAGRSDGVVKGTVLVDGQPPDAEFYRTTGYVEQFDLHDDQSTVREALEFSAILRQDSKIPRAEKLAYVEVVLDLLDLTHLQDAIIGHPSAGLSLEQRKRLTIAVEVVSRPAILFCDEPTTGLDTKSALRVVRLLRRLARSGLAVVATIHQPSAETFNIFETLLLLQRGGKQVYFGPRDAAVAFFLPSGLPDDQTNPAEFLLDAAGAGADVPDENLSIVSEIDILSKRWKSSSQARVLQESIASLSSPENSRPRKVSTSATRIQQCLELTKRVSRHYYRDLSYSYTKIFTATVVSLIIGLSFYKLNNSVVSLDNRLFSVFLILFVPPVFMNLGIFKMFKLRRLWEAREGPSKIYGRTAFVTSLIVSEVPYSLLCATIYFVLWYFMVGLPLVTGTALYTFAMVQLFFFFMSTWAMWITALAPSLGMVANILPFFLVTMEAFNGALMPYAQMPHPWRWLYWASPFQWYVRGVVGVLLHKMPVECELVELVTFESPDGTTCGEYTAEYLSTHAGYLVDAASDSLCQFCKFAIGDDFLASINISYSDRWLAFGVFFTYTITNILLIYVFTYYPPRLPSWRPKSSRRRAMEVAEEVVALEEAERIGAEVLAEGTRGAFT